MDGDSEPSGPVKTVDKASTHTTKRNVEPQAPSKPAGADGARRNGPGGSEGGSYYPLSYGAQTVTSLGARREAVWLTFLSSLPRSQRRP